MDTHGDDGGDECVAGEKRRGDGVGDDARIRRLVGDRKSGETGYIRSRDRATGGVVRARRGGGRTRASFRGGGARARRERRRLDGGDGGDIETFGCGVASPAVAGAFRRRYHVYISRALAFVHVR